MILEVVTMLVQGAFKVYNALMLGNMVANQKGQRVSLSRGTNIILWQGVNALNASNALGFLKFDLLLAEDFLRMTSLLRNLRCSQSSR